MAAGSDGQGMGGALRRAWFGSAMYRLTLGGRAPRAFLVVPADDWPGDAERGNQMLAGEFLAEGRVHRLDSDPWGSQVGDPVWLAELHGFAWLRDVRESGGEEAARFSAAMVDGWIARHGTWSALPWRPDVLGERLSHWIAHSAMILRGGEPALADRFFTSLATQRRHLARAVPGGVSGLALILAIKGLIMAHLALEARPGPLEEACGLLDEALKAQVLPDGGHVERSPAVLARLLHALIDLRAALATAHKPVSDTLSNAIDRLAPAVRFFRHGDGGLALFNDTREGDPATLDLLLTRSGASGKPLSQLPHTGFQRLIAGNTMILVDGGPPPPRGLDAHAHAGTLSFEMSIGRERLVVNCGAYAGPEPAWRLAQRTTAAHSTAIIDDTNSAELRDEGSLGWRPTQVEAQRNDAEGACWLDLSHDGWLELYRAIHRRRIYVAAGGHNVRGEDRFVNDSGAPIRAAGRPFAVRFHLHPNVRASLVHGGSAALLQLGNGQGWRFDVADAEIDLAESIYLGRGPVRRTTQIVINGTIEADGARVKWAFTRMG